MASALYPIQSLTLTSGTEFGVKRYSHAGASITYALDLPCVVASFAGAQVLRGHIGLPNPLPSGTAKWVMSCLAQATSGNLQYQFKGASLALDTGSGGDATGAAQTATATQTITWASGDDDVIQQATVDVPAGVSLTAGEIVQVEIELLTASTIASDVFFLLEQIGIRWE